MEQWDIYDENKQKTGRTMNRNDWNMQPGDFHLTVLGVLRRPDGTYLITRRRMDKEWAPGCWEVPGGGVRAGESAEDAVKREILEETGVDVSNAGTGEGKARPIGRREQLLPRLQVVSVGAGSGQKLENGRHRLPRQRPRFLCII